MDLYQDTGFRGYAPDGVKTFQPQKKPKGKELAPEQKEHNRLISSIRMVIEHIIAGIKRCRIVKDIFRNTQEQYDDLVMEIACGLHNFRVHCRGAEKLICDNVSCTPAHGQAQRSPHPICAVIPALLTTDRGWPPAARCAPYGRYCRW